MRLMGVASGGKPVVDAVDVLDGWGYGRDGEEEEGDFVSE